MEETFFRKKSHPVERKRPRTTEGMTADEEAKILFASLPFKHRYVGFLHTVSSCLITESGALVLWAKLRIRDMDLWKFYFLSRDAPNSTIEFALPQFQIEKTPSMLYPINHAAIFSEQYATQLLTNYVRILNAYSTEILNDHRESVLKAPYFICESKEEAQEKTSLWMKTEEGSRLTVLLMGKHVPDTVPEEDEFTCMICMDNAPSTYVNPCGHVVVCSTCSIGLRDTADKGICVRCRTPIESIEDLCTGEITLIE